MNKFLKASALLLALGFSANVYAQDAKATAPRARTTSDENIVIRKKGANTEKLTIVVDGEKITVNGKPVDEFKSDNIEVIKEKAFPSLNFAYSTPSFEKGDWDVYSNNFARTIKGNKAVLGVMTEKTADGAKITDVTDESAADKAGLKEGDIINKFGDTKIEDADDLYKAVGKYKPEDKVTVAYKRDGKDASAQVTLLKSKTALVYGINGSRDLAMKVAPGAGVYSFYRGRPRMGVQVQDTEDGKGVKVLDVDDETPAEKAGLKEDDVITQVNGKDITSVDDLKTAVKDGKDGDTFKVTYKRGSETKTVDVHYPKELKTSNL